MLISDTIYYLHILNYLFPMLKWIIINNKEVEICQLDMLHAYSKYVLILNNELGNFRSFE